MGTSVYLITSGDGKQYVGISMWPQWRLSKHLKDDNLVGRSLRKHGLLRFEILHESIDRAEAIRLEIELIEKLNTRTPYGLNITAGGEGAVGLIMSESAKQKLRDKQLSIPKEVRTERARSGGLKAAELSTPEERIERSRKASQAAAVSPVAKAVRSASMRRYLSSLTPEQRSERGRRAHQTRLERQSNGGQ